MRRLQGRLGGSLRGLVLDVTPFRESVGFRALWVGQIISLLGTQMRFVAVPYQVFALTGSTVAVGMIGLVEVVPLIVFSLVGGALADRRDRRAVMAWSQVLLCADMALLAAVSLSDSPPLWAVYVLTGIAGAVSAVDRPALTAMVPSLVSPEQLPAAMSLRQVVYQVTYIAGPALGGALIAALSGEVAAVYAVDAATFLGALVALRWVPSRPPARRPELSEGPVAAVREGVRFAWRTPVILAIFVTDLVAMVFGMPRAVFPELAERTFGLGPAGLGMLYAAPAAGALVGAVTTGWTTRVRRQGLAVIAAVTLWGAAITLAGLCVFSLALFVILLAVAGGADVISAVFRSTILQQATPDELRGRASALNLMVVSGGPRLGDVEAGLAAGLVGAHGSVVLGGAACLLGTGVVAWRFPQLRAYLAPAPGPVRARS